MLLFSEFRETLGENSIFSFLIVWAGSISSFGSIIGGYSLTKISFAIRFYNSLSLNWLTCCSTDFSGCKSLRTYMMMSAFLGSWLPPSCLKSREFKSTLLELCLSYVKIFLGAVSAFADVPKLCRSLVNIFTDLRSFLISFCAWSLLAFKFCCSSAFYLFTYSMNTSPILLRIPELGLACWNKCFFSV